MSVFLENRGRGRGYEDVSDPSRGDPRTSRPLERGGQSRWRRRDRDDPPLWGFSYDQAEGVIHLLLAFSIVGGAAALLSSGLFAPDAANVRKAEPRVAAVAPSAAPAPQRPTAPTLARASAEPARTEPRPVEAPGGDARPAASIAKAEQTAPAPVAAPAVAPAPSQAAIVPAPAPEPLAPPPPELRERLDATQKRAVLPPPPEPATAEAQSEETPARDEPLASKSAGASSERAKPENPARFARCYLKLGGRVQSSGSCRVRHTEDSIILELPGKPLEIAHAHGRVWTATLGGRSLGRVYRSGSCWGARGFYACENG